MIFETITTFTYFFFILYINKILINLIKNSLVEAIFLKKILKLILITNQIETFFLYILLKNIFKKNVQILLKLELLDKILLTKFYSISYKL